MTPRRAALAREQDGAAPSQAAERGGRPTVSFPIVRFRDGEARRASDLLAAEEPLEVRLGGERVAVTMRTPVPGQDAELALGFLLGEGIVSLEAVGRIAECRAPNGDGGVADVLLRPGAEPAGGWQRRFYATSSCGVCGKESIEAVKVGARPVPDGPRIGADVLSKMPAQLRSAQRVFERTGGLHAAGLFSTGGRPLVVREDVGRHNAVDKLVGRAAMDGRLPLHDGVLVVSGRSSFEIVQKALVAGVPVVAGVSAPSSLAARLAGESNMTLVGFLRPGGFNVYCGADRIAGV